MLVQYKQPRYMTSYMVYKRTLVAYIITNYSATEHGDQDAVVDAMVAANASMNCVYLRATHECYVCTDSRSPSMY
jgi:hypothetical protein